MKQPDFISLDEASAFAGAKNVRAAPLSADRTAFIEGEAKKRFGIGEIVEDIRVDLERLALAEAAGPDALEEFYGSQHKLVLTY